MSANSQAASNPQDANAGPAVPQRPPFPHNLRALFLDRLEGAVLTVGPETQSPKKRSVPRVIILVLVIWLLPILLCTALALRFMGWRGGGGGGIARDILLLNLHGSFGATAAAPSWDLRLCDPSGAEHAIRLEGRDTTGPPAPGDVVVFWGRIRHGTMVVETGFNERTGSWMYLS